MTETRTLRLGPNILIQFQSGAVEALLEHRPVLVVVVPRNDAGERAELERQAAAVARAPVAERRDLLPDERVELALEQARGPLTIGQLAKAAGLSKDVTRLSLRDLVNNERVQSTGTGRSTTYRLRQKRGRR